MCCLPKRRRPQRPPHPPRPPHHPRKSSHGELQNSSLSSSGFASTTKEFSSTSTSSIASIKDMLPGGPSLYRFQEICLATDNFDPAKQVGRSVWKASLRDAAVAISRKPGCSRDLRRVIRRVHSLHHYNLVKLLGACHEGEFLFIVYEFMESSNLRDCLRSKHGVSFSALSSWLSRLHIALDVAKGLEYLHHLTTPALIHKYIDSRNILVGNDLRAKVAHVGVAVLTGEIELLPEKLPEPDSGEIQPHDSKRRVARSHSIKINGIQGYMPPEYLNCGEVSPKYDVFSFGVVLAEILSGREAVASQPRQAAKRLSLPDMLRSVMTGDDAKRKLREWMDPLLRDSYPVDDAYKLASVALSCLDPDPLKRPEMSDVALRLHRLLSSAEKWEATVGARQEILTASLQPR
eukprot:c7600_g1_i1 orf=571-1785(-)